MNTTNIYHFQLSPTTNWPPIVRSVCRCLHSSQTYPQGRFVWCNDGRHGGGGGPTTKTVDSYGHACCKNFDFCNLKLSPIIRNRNYKKGGQKALRMRSRSHRFYNCSVNLFTTPSLKFKKFSHLMNVFWKWNCFNLLVKPTPPKNRTNKDQHILISQSFSVLFVDSFSFFVLSCI